MIIRQYFRPTRCGDSIGFIRSSKVTAEPQERRATNLVCVRYGGLLPGKKIVPERIRENREPYYAALRAADRAWANGDFDVSELADYLQGLLRAQLSDG